ncbi:MAG: HEPN domain-containing protein [Thermoguttaceae bacterium]
MSKKKTKQPWIISEDGKSLLENFAGESERTRVIIASSFLENGLEACLRLKFKNEMNGEDSNIVNKLFDSTLRDFGRKNLIARVLGIINHPTYEAIDSIREIRNAFAHENFKIKLSHTSLNKYIGKLKDYLQQKYKERERLAWEKEEIEHFSKHKVSITDKSDLYFSLAVVNLFGYLGVAEFNFKVGGKGFGQY